MTCQVNIDDGFLNLMDNDGNPKDDVKVPEEEIGKQISEAFEEGKDLLVTIVAAMGEEQVRFVSLSNSCYFLNAVFQAISFKEAPSKG